MLKHIFGGPEIKAALGQPCPKQIIAEGSDEICREARDRRPSPAVADDIGDQISDSIGDAAGDPEENTVHRHQQAYRTDIRKARDDHHHLEGNGNDQINQHQNNKYCQPV